MNPAFFAFNVLKQFPDAEITFEFGDDVRGTIFLSTKLRIPIYSQTQSTIFIAVVTLTLKLADTLSL